MLTRHYKELTKGYRWPFKPVMQSIEFNKPVQVALPFIGTENCAHVQMGLFYALLSAAMFGGKLVDSLVVSNGADFYSLNKPDVMDKQARIAIESKAMRSGHQLNLLDFQVERYRVFQVLRPTYKLWYIFYRHGVLNIKGRKEPLKELNGMFARKTYAAIAVTFDVVLSLFNAVDIEGIKRYEKIQVWPDCTRLGSTLLNRFLLEPEVLLDEFGLGAVQYNIDKFLVSGIIVRNELVDSFPMVIVEKKNYRKWARALADEVPF